MMNVVALAGGVGGAKLVLGLSKILNKENLNIVVNTGDDFNFFGLDICPDLDTVMYSLAEISNDTTGWGRANETWNCLEELKKLDHDTWFNLGDKDIANHLFRTNLLRDGNSLTEVTQLLAHIHGIDHQIYPMCDQKVSTMIETEAYGKLSFQEYFVKYHFEPKILDISFYGIEQSKISASLGKQLEKADLIIICPSNPWLSIFPILSVGGFKESISGKNIIAVSPIVGHEAIKGPAAKIFKEKEITPSAYEVARLYKDLIKMIVIDHKNQDEEEDIKSLGIIPFVTDTIMNDLDSKIRLAQRVLDYASKFF